MIRIVALLLLIGAPAANANLAACAQLLIDRTVLLPAKPAADAPIARMWERYQSELARERDGQRRQYAGKLLPPVTRPIFIASDEGLLLTHETGGNARREVYDPDEQAQLEERISRVRQALAVGESNGTAARLFDSHANTFEFLSAPATVENFAPLAERRASLRESLLWAALLGAVTANYGLDYHRAGQEDAHRRRVVLSTVNHAATRIAREATPLAVKNGRPFEHLDELMAQAARPRPPTTAHVERIYDDMRATNFDWPVDDEKLNSTEMNMLRARVPVSANITIAAPLMGASLAALSYWLVGVVRLFSGGSASARPTRNSYTMAPELSQYPRLAEFFQSLGANPVTAQQELIRFRHLGISVGARTNVDFLVRTVRGDSGVQLTASVVCWNGHDDSDDTVGDDPGVLERDLPAAPPRLPARSPSRSPSRPSRSKRPARSR